MNLKLIKFSQLFKSIVVPMLLSLIYFIIITPVGIFIRLSGKDLTTYSEIHAIASANLIATLPNREGANTVRWCHTCGTRATFAGSDQVMCIRASLV